MRWEAGVWAAVALLLMGAEALLPGAFMLWMGFAAAAVFLVVLVIPDLPLLAQILFFVLFSVVSVLVYRRWFYPQSQQSDRPLLNRRAEQLIGRVARLDQPIVSGRGRVQLDDAYWVVTGPDLPAGTQVRIAGADGMTLLVEAL
ncbi:MAG TPA: NfeD family protein [Pseudoxanthomonas sp.]|nr:NfeD family protein [Pseudoxanthomonas sp.]